VSDFVFSILYQSDYNCDGYVFLPIRGIPDGYVTVQTLLKTERRIAICT
jgi:hypothetical protein